jgi:hypothetical protein
MRHRFTPKPYWLIHHDTLLEVSTESIQRRRRYVREFKYFEEVPTRLKWMRPVQRVDLLPKEVRRAIGIYTREVRSLGVVTPLSIRILERAVRRNWKRVVARHRKECPGCPFDYRKKTLFL